MKILNFAAVSALIFSAGLTAGPQQESDAFKSLDRDGDGRISIIEATGNNDILKNWVEIDADANGQVEMSEFSAFETENMPAHLYEPIDVNPEPGAAPTE